MSSFLDRLKKKQVVPGNSDDAKSEKIAAQVASAPAPVESALSAEQLKVDIYKAENAIIIYAQVSGSKIDMYDVLIEGDSDVVTITGQRIRPAGDRFARFSIEGKEKVLEECSWGKFYRQIILPAEVDPSQTEAVMTDGVLALLLPLKRTKSSGVKIKVNAV